MSTKEFEERIATLEKDKSCPGTILSRVLTVDGFAWNLCLGTINMTKKFYNGDSIESVLSQAEKDNL